MAHGDFEVPSGYAGNATPATWEDIMNLPEHHGAEIIGGKIHYKGMARARHGHATTQLQRRVPNERQGVNEHGWWIFGDVDVKLAGESYLKPDVSGWRKERMPEPPDDWPLAIAPDWVCEVLSPTTEAYDRGDKAQAYAAGGVPWYWIVDPAERTVEVLELINGRWTIWGVYTDGAALALPPFDGTVVEIGGLFLPVVAGAGQGASTSG